MKYTATEDDAGKRVDTFVAENMLELSRSSIRKLMDDKKITIKGQPIKQSYKVDKGDEVDVAFDPDELNIIPEIDLPILYEDEDCIVINKPTGVLTHSKGAFNPEGTVATFIQPKVKGAAGDRAGIVHRLDRATSGVIICAKTQDALTALQKEFSLRKAKKTYYAVVEGDIDPPKAVIDVPLLRNPRDPKTFKPSLDGKNAVTAYEVEATGNGYSLVKLNPQTGRTHQLRIHLKYLGHPILGDAMYEGTPHKRLMLHAEKLEITLPNRERKVFEAPLPPEFRAILEV